MQWHYLYYKLCRCNICCCGMKSMLFKNTSKRIMSICASGRGFTVVWGFSTHLGQRVNTLGTAPRAGTCVHCKCKITAPPTRVVIDGVVDGGPSPCSASAPIIGSCSSLHIYQPISIHSLHLHPDAASTPTSCIQRFSSPTYSIIWWIQKEQNVFQYKIKIWILQMV